jgi:FkbM family methyltransferase
MIGTKIGRWGPVKYFLKDEYVGKSIHYYGEYNPDETEKIVSLAKPGMLCLDIGANIGCISQALLKSDFEVVAFEPQPEVYNLLEFNCPGADIYNVAIGKEKSTAQMPKVYYSEKNNVGGLSLNTKSQFGSYAVPVETLDSYNFSNVGFIKIDVEGFEEQVLLGGLETINKYKPVLYIEDDRVQNTAALRKLIKEIGYSIEEHKPMLYRENNFFNNKKDVWNVRYFSHNIICLPENG